MLAKAQKKVLEAGLQSIVVSSCQLNLVEFVEVVVNPSTFDGGLMV